MSIENYDAAIVYFQNALNVLSNFIIELPIIKTYLAETYYLKNDLSSAETLLNSNLRGISNDKFNQLRKKHPDLGAHVFLRK